MGVLVFSFLIPGNYLHGSSQSSPAGGPTEREAGARAREKPSVTDYDALGYHTWGCLETFPRCWRRVSPLCSPASAPLLPRSLCRFTGSERAYCSSLHRLPLALIATCVLSHVVMALIANICWRLSMCHCVKRFTHITSLSLLHPCEALIPSFHK